MSLFRPFMGGRGSPPVGAIAKIRQWPATVGTTERRLRERRVLGGDVGELDAERGGQGLRQLLCTRVGLRKLLLKGGQGLAGAGMQEAAVSDFLKAFGQHMLQEPLQEAHRVQRHGRPGFPSRRVAEGDGAIFHANESAVRPRHPGDVGCQIFQGGLPVAHRLAVHDPVFAPGLRGDLGNHGWIGVLQGLAELRPKDLAQSRSRHQKLRMRREPRPGLRIDPPGRHQIMDMDMIAHAAIPGVQRPDHPDLPAQPVWIQGQGLEGLGRGLEQEIVDQFLVRPRHRIQRMGQGERHQKIGHRQEFLHLSVAPGVSPVATALGTVPVAAGMITIDILLAGVAPKQLAAHQRDVRQCSISHSASQWLGSICSPYFAR